MNIKKNFVIAFALGATIFAFSTAAAFGQIAPPDQRPQFSLYGMHFISGGQTVRVAVQNSCVSDAAAVGPCNNPEIIPCIRVRVVFDVYEQSPTQPGRLRFVRRVAREVLLDGGEAATFEFPAGRGGDWISPAVFARPEEVGPPDVRPIRLVSTLSVRQFGLTVFNLPAELKGFDPQPDPPAAREQ